MKSNASAPTPNAHRFAIQPPKWYPKQHRLTAAIRLVLLSLILPLLASCSSLGKPEQRPSNLPPACNQREPALDSGDPPEDGNGGPSLDWMAWAQAYVRAQWAIVDRDNKRAATADCLDDIAAGRS